MANIWFYMEEKRKMIDCTGGCETETDFVLVGNNTDVRDVEVIPR